MSVYYPTGCQTLPAPFCSNCPAPELGRVRSFWVQASTYSFINYQNPVEWQQQIVAGNVYIFPYAQGSVDFSENLTDGFGNVDQNLMSYSVTVTVKEPSYPNNAAFWNAIKKSNFWLCGVLTQTQMWVSSVAATWIPKAPIANDIKSRVDWNIMAKFVQEDLPVPMAQPVGTFAQCIDAG